MSGKIESASNPGFLSEKIKQLWPSDKAKWWGAGAGLLAGAAAKLSPAGVAISAVTGSLLAHLFRRKN